MKAFEIGTSQHFQTADLIPTLKATFPHQVVDHNDSIVILQITHLDAGSSQA